MSVPTIPISKLRWATAPLSGGDVVEPDNTTKDEGWQAAEEPPHSFFNYWQNVAYLWFVYLGNIQAELSVLAFTWTLAHIFQKGITVTQSTSNLNGGTFTGNGTAYGLQATGGSTSGHGGGFTGVGVGTGVIGAGGATNADGVAGFGGGTTGIGVHGFGGSGGAGGVFVAGGNAVGVQGSVSGGAATGNGVLGIGGTSGANGAGAGVKGTNSNNGDGVYGSTSGAGDAGRFVATGVGAAVFAKGSTNRAPLHLDPLSGNPSNQTAGDIYFDQSSGKLKFYDGTSWVTVTST